MKKLEKTTTAEEVLKVTKTYELGDIDFCELLYELAELDSKGKTFDIQVTDVKRQMVRITSVKGSPNTLRLEATKFPVGALYVLCSLLTPKKN